MPLLLLDLDNTLVDRASAFRRWAEGFVAEHRPDLDGGVEWLVLADRDGYEPRDELALRVRDKFDLGPRELSDLATALRWGMADHLELDPAVPQALEGARAAGWTPVIVTNGTVEQQERKLSLTGLDRLVAGWVVSEAAGVKKPDGRIFRLAAEAAGASLAGAWMVGDSAHADIAGAHRLGLRSVWLHRGRQWREEGFAPTQVADDCAQAVSSVLAAA